MPHSLIELWNEWKPERDRRPSLWVAAAALLLTLLPLAQFVHFHAKEGQLARREQLLNQTYDDVQRLVQTTEQVAHQIERDLREQERMMALMEVNLGQTTNRAPATSNSVELPLQPAP
jgi:hypothetical protein